MGLGEKINVEDGGHESRPGVLNLTDQYLYFDQNSLWHEYLRKKFEEFFETTFS